MGSPGADLSDSLASILGPQLQLAFGEQIFC